MNVTRTKLIAAAITMSLAGTTGVALAAAHETSMAEGAADKTAATAISKDRMEAKEDMLEEKAEVKEDKIDEMDSSQPVSDSWITTKVKSQLAATEEVRSLEITVNTVDGVVFLTGVVGDAAMATKATAAAKTVKGVKSVDASGLKSTNLKHEELVKADMAMKNDAMKSGGMDGKAVGTSMAAGAAGTAAAT